MDVRMQGVLIEGENLNIIRLMCDSVTRNFWEGHPSLSQDIAFLASFKQVVFLHTQRDCNRAAHFCATLALERSFVLKHVNASSDLTSILSDDRSHFVHP